jgi:hypothetical protein
MPASAPCSISLTKFPSALVSYRLADETDHHDRGEHDVGIEKLLGVENDQPRPQLDAASISAPITAIHERRNDCRNPAMTNGEAPGMMTFQKKLCRNRGTRQQRRLSMT